MHYRALFIVLLAAACGDDTTTTSFGGTSTGEPGTTGPGTGEPTTAGPTTEPTTDATTQPGTDTATTGPDTTGPGTASTTEPGTTGGTTGGAGLCGEEGESIHAELLHVGDAPPCGPLEFTGQLVSDPKGPVWMLDGCPCGADCLQPDPWSFTLTSPAEWLPVLPACPVIVVERVMGFAVCEFASVSIWDAQKPDEPAFYHAGAGLSPTQAAAEELELARSTVETCDCDFCCAAPELWDLEFTHLGAKATASEGATVPIGGFTAVNFESHLSGLCDAPLDVSWVLRKNP